MVTTGTPAQTEKDNNNNNNKEEPVQQRPKDTICQWDLQLACSGIPQTQRLFKDSPSEPQTRDDRTNFQQTEAFPILPTSKMPN